MVNNTLVLMSPVREVHPENEYISLGSSFAMSLCVCAPTLCDMLQKIAASATQAYAS